MTKRQVPPRSVLLSLKRQGSHETRSQWKSPLNVWTVAPGACCRWRRPGCRQPAWVVPCAGSLGDSVGGAPGAASQVEWRPVQLRAAAVHAAALPAGPAGTPAVPRGIGWHPSSTPYGVHRALLRKAPWQPRQLACPGSRSTPAERQGRRGWHSTTRGCLPLVAVCFCQGAALASLVLPAGCSPLLQVQCLQARPWSTTLPPPKQMDLAAARCASAQRRPLCTWP